MEAQQENEVAKARYGLIIGGAFLAGSILEKNRPLKRKMVVLGLAGIGFFGLKTRDATRTRDEINRNEELRDNVTLKILIPVFRDTPSKTQ